VAKIKEKGESDCMKNNNQNRLVEFAFQITPLPFRPVLARMLLPCLVCYSLTLLLLLLLFFTLFVILLLPLLFLLGQTLRVIHSSIRHSRPSSLC
jgi:hypothetical protein